MVPQRPDLGTSGRAIQLRTNFFPLETLPNSTIYHYSVSIFPDVPPAKNRKIFLLWEQASNDQGLLNGIMPVYDGRFNMYSPAPLPFKGEMAVFQIDYYEEDEFPPCLNPTEACLKRVPKTFEMTLTKITEVNFDKLRLFLKGLSNETPDEELAVLDVVMRHRPSLMFTTVGRSFYTPDAAATIANGAQLWQGFHQSLRPTRGRLLINLDVSATAFYQAGSVLLIVAQLLGKNDESAVASAIPAKEISKLDRALKGLKVVVSHRGQIRRKYKIAKLTLGDANTTKFLLNDGSKSMSVAEYFEQKYSLKLQYPHLPCLVIGDENRAVFLPMEICDIVPGQRHLKKLNERQTSEMIKFTCQAPHVRSNKISTGMTLLHEKDDEYLNEFGIQVSNQMLTVPARVLPAPTLSYHPASKEPLIQPKEGAWNLRDKMLAQGATLECWSVLVFGTEKDIPLNVVQKFISMLCTTCEECGVFIKSKQPPIAYANPFGNIEKSVIDSYMSAGNTFKMRPQLLMCILPNTGVPLYAEIKRVADTVIGVATQCIQNKHMYASKRQYCANVCLKMNVKLGGMNSFLSGAQLPFVSSKPTIVLGADVTHPALGSASSQSIAALVGSLDGQCSRYSASIRTQIGKMEWIQDLAGMMIELLRTFYQTSGAKPQSILMYRDAVSESQFHNVAEKEVQFILDACQSLEPGYRPKITYVAVQKRHHARFFPIKAESADKSGNVLPGTIVESEITHPSQFDFYLCSHPGLQGTSKPTHYHVLHDENEFTADGLQEFSYRLCYLYCRATRAVSVVPPAYYAHLVATRARFHSKDQSEDESRFTLSSKAHVEKIFAAVKEELSKVMYFM